MEQVKNAINHKEIYENFKRYCKNYQETVMENGSKRVTLKKGDSFFNVDYINGASNIYKTDGLCFDLNGQEGGGVLNLEQLLEAAAITLGPDSLRTEEELKKYEEDYEQAIEECIARR